MFDYNLILIDGSVNLTGNTDTPAISTTKSATTGAVVIDLGAGGTPVSGLAAVLILPTAAVASSTLTGFIEASDTEDMTTASPAGTMELGKFGVASATKGVILAAEVVATTVPVIVVMRIATEKRYVRANLTVNGTTEYSFYLVKCYLSPFPFHILT